MKRRAHTPPHTPPPGPPAGGPTAEPATEPGVDLVAGDPPVPITVWRTPAADERASVPTRLAQRLVAAYSRPGETVIDLTDDHALTVAAVPGGRRHHRAWFTDAAALIIGPPTSRSPEPGAGRLADAPARRRGKKVDPPELAAWFGDDLTDPDLPPPETTAARRAGGADTVTGATSLLVTCWPLHAVDANNRKRLRSLLRGGVSLLRPGGCLVLVVRAPADTPPTVVTAPEDFGPLVVAARDAGLGYLQHIVAVRADTSGDQFTYYATDDELLTLAQAGQPWAVAHLRVHADLLVFTARQGPPGGGGARD